jgi:hypothetical protein
MRISLCIAFVAGLSLPGGAVLAQTVAQPAQPRIDFSRFNASAADLPDAVAAIEASGAKVLDIRYHELDGKPGYDVVVLRNGRVEFVRSAKAAPGFVAVAGHSEPAWMLDWRARRNVDAARKTDVALADAIRKAEMANGGAPAVAAGIAVSAANPTSVVDAYNVLLKTSAGVQRVAIDSRTGVPIANPSALKTWP